MAVIVRGRAPGDQAKAHRKGPTELKSTISSALAQAEFAKERSMHLASRALLLFLVVAASHAGAGELGVNLYGLSYHFEHERAKETGLDNTVNPGVGVRYLIGENQSLRWFADAGIYRDSSNGTAKLAGAAVHWKVTGSLGLGGALVAFHGPAYNQGRTFVTLLPVVSYELKPVTLNLFYAPKLRELNEINTLGFWVTVWPGRW
jgi:hypothetical protein